MTFGNWFNQTEAFGFRSERFHDDLISYRLENVEAELVVKWLNAAYNAGYNDRDIELMESGK